MEGYKRADFAPPTKVLRPQVIATPGNLKDVFTKAYDPNCGVSFALWVTGLIAAWCWAVWGCRPNVDMNSLKKSIVHDHNHEQGWASTAYSGGRNKLAGNKKGSRPWSAFFVCMCPGGKHQTIPENWEWTLDADGNPQGQIPFPTECPLNCCELKRRRKVNGEK